MTKTSDLAFGTLMSRILRLRCPACGGDRVFPGLLGVKDQCGACGFNCRLEGGYYIGAIYINYGVTAIVGLLVATPFVIAGRMTTGMIVGFAAAVIVAIAFFQRSRSLWLGIHYWFRRNG